MFSRVYSYVHHFCSSHLILLCLLLLIPRANPYLPPSLPLLTPPCLPPTYPRAYPLLTSSPPPTSPPPLYLPPTYPPMLTPTFPPTYSYLPLLPTLTNSRAYPECNFHEGFIKLYCIVLYCTALYGIALRILRPRWWRCSDISPTYPSFTTPCAC